MQGNSREHPARPKRPYRRATLSDRNAQSRKICSSLSSKIKSKTETRESPGPTHTLEFIQRESVSQVWILIFFL